MATTPFTPAASEEQDQQSPFRAAIHRAGLFVFSPVSYCRALKKKPTWKISFIVSSIAIMSATWWTIPFTSRGLQMALPAGATPEHLAALMKQVQTGQYLGVALAPLILLVKAAICAAMLTMIVQLVTVEGSFRELFALLVNLLPITALQGLMALLVLKLRGLDAIQSATDVQVSFGLNLLFRDTSPAVDTLLRSINCFEILIFIYLVIGIGALTRCRRWTAIAIGLSYWMIGTAVSMGLVVVAADLRSSAG